jgi:hypothetical protein
MAAGESAKRRQQRGVSWGQALGDNITVASNSVAVSLAIPPEATHMRVFANSTSTFVRFGWNVEPIVTSGTLLGLRTPEVFAVTPEATTIQFILASTGSVGVSVYFYAVGSQA